MIDSGETGKVHVVSTDTPRQRVLAILAGAVTFGAVVAVLKGGDAGVRDSVGNISAPWLLLPYFAGAATPGWRRGAVLGAAACFAALAGFYIAEAFVLDLGEHPLLTDLALTLGAGRYYFIAGAVFGPLFGAVGGAATRHRGAVTAAVVALLLVGEPLAVFAWLAQVGIDSSDTGMVTAYPSLWIGEMLLGLLMSLGVLIQTRRKPTARPVIRSRR